ncbi:glutamate racemase [Roseburia inulinivorans]
MPCWNSNQYEERTDHGVCKIEEKKAGNRNMDEMQRPIGVFDSGVGGISVLRELVALMPNENFIFYGDSKNAPYGTKTLEEVRKLTLADAEYLMTQNVKALVVACNTATSAAIHILREKYQKEIPVIGIEPALKPAVSVKENPRVLVMATPMTLREKKFHNLMQKFQDQAEIISLPCPGLVEFVERGELSGEALEHFLKNLFAPYQERKVDAVVLGCTHYPLVRETIQKVLGQGVAVFDGGAGTARETLHKLKEYSLVSDAVTPGTVQFYNSAEDQKMIGLSKYLLEQRQM